MNTDKHAHEYCPRCRTTAHTYTDEHHAETYCEKCGLVIRDSSINSISQYIRLDQYREHQLYKLHYKKRERIRG